MVDPDKFEPIRNFYDEDYYADPAAHGAVSWHDLVIAGRLGELRGARVLDVACGLGQWLGLLQEHGADVAGIDISARAVAHCRERFPRKEFHVGPAETLPFADGSFDLVTCMGSLEHFLDKPAALREMLRVARPDARFLILVPNAGFLTRRLGLYGGTQQARVSEDVYPLERWRQLLVDAGLQVEHRWRDLHTLSRAWIMRGPAWGWPLRALQAAVLPLWPMAWQYQVHHYCRRSGQS